jgi:hypothetical protein
MLDCGSSKREVWRFALAAVLVSWVATACSDVGDSSAVPGENSVFDAGASDASMSTTPESGTLPGQDATAMDATSEAAAATPDAAGAGPDASTTTPDSGSTAVDATTTPPGMDASLAIDVGADSVSPVDATLADATGSDGSPRDVASPDTGADARGADASSDTGTADAGRLDASPDAGNEGGPDAGGDATTGTDAGSGGGPGPCVYSGPQGTCSPTEQIVVDYDTAHGQSLATGCYSCMALNACLDSAGTLNGLGADVVSTECGDPDPAVPAPPFAPANGSSSNVAACLDAFTCVLTSAHCSTAVAGSSADPNASVSNCFCGTATGGMCIASATSPNGPCAANEYTDLGLPGDPTMVESHFTDTSIPGGVGNALLNCALTAGCDACFN